MKISRLMLNGAAVVATLGATALPATAEIDEIRWAVPISFSSSLTALGDTLPWVAERLADVSDGKIMIEVVEPGAMIPALAVFESAATGQIEAGYSWMGYERGQVPASALFGATPFGLEPAGYTAWMYQGGGDELLKETFEPFGVYPILCGTIPRIPLKNSLLIEEHPADSIPVLGWRIGDDGTEAGGAARAVLRVLA